MHPPPSKVLEKNKPPGGLNRGFTVGVLWFAYFLVSSVPALKAFRFHHLCGRSDLEPSVQLSFGPSQPCLRF